MVYTLTSIVYTVSSVRSKILVIYWLKKQPFSILMTYTFIPLLSFLGLGSFVLGPQLTMPRKRLFPALGSWSDDAWLCLGDHMVTGMELLLC